MRSLYRCCALALLLTHTHALSTKQANDDRQDRPDCDSCTVDIVENMEQLEALLETPTSQSERAAPTAHKTVNRIIPDAFNLLRKSSTQTVGRTASRSNLLESSKAVLQAGLRAMHEHPRLVSMAVLVPPIVSELL